MFLACFGFCQICFWVTCPLIRSEVLQRMEFMYLFHSSLCREETEPICLISFSRSLPSPSLIVFVDNNRYFHECTIPRLENFVDNNRDVMLICLVTVKYCPSIHESLGISQRKLMQELLTSIPPSMNQAVLITSLVLVPPNEKNCNIFCFW